MESDANKFRRCCLHKTLVATCLCISILTTTAIADDCIQFRVVGVCLWIVCTAFGCDIDVTIKYGHFNPDVIISVTNEQGVDRVEDPIRDDTRNRNHNNLIYQDSKAYGHPLTGQIYCPSNTTAGGQYFHSLVDMPSWRYGGLDSFTTAVLIPGSREIGDWPTNTWGPLYPRTGWTTQHSEPKASAIVSQRVGDIITRSEEPHLYRSILGNPIFIEDHKITWSPDSLEENTNEEGWFQPTTPKLESCLLFGEDDTTALTGWGGGRVSENGEYRYALWRPYTCCEIDDGALIVIDFSSYPVSVVTN